MFKKLKKYIGMFAYEFIGKHLPTSFSRFQIGQKRFRAACARSFTRHIGKNVNIEKGAMFSTLLSVGDNSGVGINAKIYGEVEIGNNVMMGPDCVIYTRNHNISNCNIPMNTQGFSEAKKVIIGDDVWICGQVIILPGVTIGNHSVIGTGAVMTKNVPDYAVVAGNPAIVKRFRLQA